MRKTPNQLKTIKISRSLDHINGLKTAKKTNHYKDPNYQHNYYLKNKPRLQKYKQEYHKRKKLNKVRN